MNDTDLAWEKWGQLDPYYGVSSIPKFRSENIARNREAFFDDGRRYIDARISKANRLYGTVAVESALDFGCGVGRLLIPLAAHFGTVTGVDISDAMLVECRANLDRFGVENATLEKSDDALSAVNGHFDFVHSYIVLQHIPVKRGMALVDRLLALTRPGGVASLQITIERGDHPLRAVLYWAQRRVPGMHVAVNVVRGRTLSEPLMQMNNYPLPAVFRLFEAHGFGEITVDPERQALIGSVNLMAKKHG